MTKNGEELFVDRCLAPGLKNKLGWGKGKLVNYDFEK